MATPSQRRLLQDLKKIKASENEGIFATPNENNILMWSALIIGPDQTIWQGGTFKLLMQFPETYPNKPPVISFKCKMFHPNIYHDGSICLDILQNNWSPAYDVSTILMSIRSLLSDPNPGSPANLQAAKIYSSNKTEYYRKVEEMVELSWVSNLKYDKT